MGYWTRAETELLINISSADAHLASVTTNWPYYLTRLDACEAFSPAYEFTPDTGGREVRGVIDQSDYTYLYLRKHLSAAQRQEFERRRAQLPAAISETTGYRAASFERETVIHAEPLRPYWMLIDTDMAHWIRRLDRHPFAVMTREELYGDPDPDAGDDHHDGDEEFTDRHRVYLLPRQLLSVRRRRRQLTDQEKQVLRDRLASFRR